ncbi:MAG: ribonuclease HII [Ignavibacteria bacterium]|nr:ribonuclease HII [Ignavibacteria bacterium]
MLICGIDEAGRGPLAGPVVAAAVIFEDGFKIKKVNDSKLLSEFERENLFVKIADKCLEYRIIEIDNTVIDEINILKATMQAMCDALQGLRIKPDKYLIDGNYFKLPDDYQTELNYETIIDGDAKVFEISAASILAKVTRDSIMRGYHLRYPEYDFYQHKGYSTPGHDRKIKKYGLCQVHRRSFCRKYFGTYNMFEDEVCL